MINLKSFIFENGEKIVTLKAYIYSVYYRLIIKNVPMKKIEKMLGKRDDETAEEENIENLKIAKLYGFHVNRITERLPWNEKCFVRALTLRRLLKEKGIHCTIYLGLHLVDGELKAHAWLRCGKLYATGGNGEGMTVVAKFSN